MTRSASARAGHSCAPPKIMVIGLDGLDLTRLLPLVEAGELPAFSRLLQAGMYGELTSVTNMTTGPTWASFATGASPNRHGILHDFYHDASYGLTPAQGRHCQVAPFWEVAAEQDRRVVVLNVPMSYPVKPLNGVILAGIDAPSERAAGFEQPPGTHAWLGKQGVDYIIDCGMASFMQQGDVAGAWRAVERETEGRTRAAEALLAHTAWDLFVTVYSLPDVWQHYYWDAPPGSPGHEQICAAHRLIDAHLARLLDLLPAVGTVLICSDHGFGPLHATRDALNGWLAEQGWAALKAPSAQGGLVRRTRAAMRSRMSFRRRQQLLARIPWLRERVETELRVGAIDFARTQVYAAMDHLELWINLAGRQAQGCVTQAEYDTLCADVAARLLQWREPSTGAPYIRDVQLQPDAATSLPHLGAIPPDLRLVWNPELALPALHELIAGDHEPGGAYIVRAPGVTFGPGPPHSLLDVAPTALHALGLEAQPTMEGCSLLLDKEQWA